jgi:hypothetical protein
MVFANDFCILLKNLHFPLAEAFGCGHNEQPFETFLRAIRDAFSSRVTRLVLTLRHSNFQQFQ